MKVLLLHPEDGFPASESARSWDLIVDLARAPLSTYQDWSRQTGCRIVSLYDFAEEIDDLYRVKALLQTGMGRVVDHLGVDWWDVTSLLIVDDLLQAILLRRLAKELGVGCKLYATRSNRQVQVLQSLCAGELHNMESGFQSISHRAKHYSEALGKLDRAQLSQVLQDTYDPEHTIRRQLALNHRKPGARATLLPSSYINVSRMAVAFADMLPDEQFLLVCARGVGKLKSLPPNVAGASLDPYFVANDRKEIASLLQGLDVLGTQLASNAEEFSIAVASGALERIPLLVRSGVAARNAWSRVFETENITSCLCTDDTAPYTRIPLILAKNRRIPTLVCHHGALDLRMPIKKPHGDVYLAKGAMERDYLLSVCRVKPEIIVTGGPAPTAEFLERVANSRQETWLVFFTEPYQADAWRSDEVYRDLLPRLCSLAKTCGLRLVFKLHPFESVNSIRKLLRKYLPPSEEREIYVFGGPISPQLWQSTKFALTVQSTVALECCARGIPVFLCSWLRARFGGYIKQYAKFGIGYVLDSAAQIADIPDLLGRQNVDHSAEGAPWQAIDRLTLHNLLHGTYLSSAALKA